MSDSLGIFVLAAFANSADGMLAVGCESGTVPPARPVTVTPARPPVTGPPVTGPPDTGTLPHSPMFVMLATLHTSNS